MADWDFDLFGDPIPVGATGRGRPPHVPTNETRQKCVLLSAVGRTPDEIAAALSITAKTLRKHYSRELRDQAAAKVKLEGKLLLGLVREVDKGSVSANRELDKRVERAHQRNVSERLSARPAAERPETKGKKAAAQDAAAEVRGKFAPPAPPSSLLN